ncbi:MAG: DciA family protein [Thermoleophilaceae bacterium]
MRRLAPRPLSAALDRVTGGLAPPSVLARVQGTWAEVAGPAVGAEAQPVSERAGTVTFECRSSVWAQELELLSGDLLERLNEALGGPSVKALRFVAGGLRRPG